VEIIADFAAVIAAIAACLTLYFAWRTIAETRRLGCEDG
jgi:hypothetical protein